jgi:ubiquinone/menaquinone biosynthesis C-methylase UbiE
MDPTRAAVYDEVATAYHETLDPNGPALNDPIFEDLVGDVRGRRVLAMACGQGRDSRLLADLGAKVVGVDVSGGMLAYARQLEQACPRGIRYVQGDGQQLEEFADASFDGVVCHMALMDIPDFASTIGAVGRVLRPGGFFVASVVHPCFAPHVDAVDGYLVDGRYQKVAGPDWLPPHAYHRSLSTYVNTLASAGLLITQIVEPPDEARAGRGVPGLLYLRCKALPATGEG